MAKGVPGRGQEVPSSREDLSKCSAVCRGEASVTDSAGRRVRRGTRPDPTRSRTGGGDLRRDFRFSERTTWA